VKAPTAKAPPAQSARGVMAAPKPSAQRAAVTGPLTPSLPRPVTQKPPAGVAVKSGVRAAAARPASAPAAKPAPVPATPDFNKVYDLLMNSPVELADNSSAARYMVLLTDRSGEVSRHLFSTKGDANAFADWYSRGVYSLQDGMIRQVEVKPVPAEKGPVSTEDFMRVMYDESAPKPGPAVTAKQLRAIMPQLPAATANALLPSLQKAMDQFGITTQRRQAAFLAEVAHESNQLRTMTEGESEYASSTSTYKGRGALQLTTRKNYALAQKELQLDGAGIDIVKNPNLVAQHPELGFLVSAWFWQKNGLNERADAVATDRDFNKISNILNRGDPDKPALHSKQRLDYYRTAEDVLGANTAP
jgi:predicted chitinase